MNFSRDKLELRLVASASRDDLYVACLIFTGVTSGLIRCNAHIAGINARSAVPHLVGPDVTLMKTKHTIIQIVARQTREPEFEFFFRDSYSPLPPESHRAAFRCIASAVVFARARRDLVWGLSYRNLCSSNSEIRTTNKTRDVAKNHMCTQHHTCGLGPPPPGGRWLGGWCFPPGFSFWYLRFDAAAHKCPQSRQFLKSPGPTTPHKPALREDLIPSKLIPLCAPGNCKAPLQHPRTPRARRPPDAPRSCSSPLAYPNGNLTSHSELGPAAGRAPGCGSKLPG